MMFTHGALSWWWFVAMPLGMVAFWALVIWVVVTVARSDRYADRSDGARRA